MFIVPSSDEALAPVHLGAYGAPPAAGFSLTRLPKTVRSQDTQVDGHTASRDRIPLVVPSEIAKQARTLPCDATSRSVQAPSTSSRIFK